MPLIERKFVLNIFNLVLLQFYIFVNTYIVFYCDRCLYFFISSTSVDFFGSVVKKIKIIYTYLLFIYYFDYNLHTKETIKKA